MEKSRVNKIVTILNMLGGKPKLLNEYTLLYSNKCRTKSELHLLNDNKLEMLLSFDNIEPIENSDLLLIRLGELLGIANITGKILIEPKFTAIETEITGVLLATYQDGTKSLIDYNAKEVIEKVGYLEITRTFIGDLDSIGNTGSRRDKADIRRIKINDSNLIELEKLDEISRQVDNKLFCIENDKITILDDKMTEIHLA